MRKKEEIEIRNNADTLVYSTEKTLKENGDKVSAEIRTEVEQKLNELKEAMKGTDAGDIKTKGDALGEVLQKVGSAMYSQPGKDGQAGEATDASSFGEPKEDGSQKSEDKSEAVEGEVVEGGKKEE